MFKEAVTQMAMMLQLHRRMAENEVTLSGKMC